MADDVGLRRRLTMPSETASAMETISSAPFCGRFGDRGNVLDGAEEVRRLDQYAGGVVVDRHIEAVEIDAAVLAVTEGRDRHALVARVGGDDFAILGMNGAQPPPPSRPVTRARHHQRLGRAGRAVVHGRVGDIHAGQFADHRLKLEDRLQRSLRDLRLIRRVRGEELAARNQRVDHHGPIVR